jgi:hypothetical protein
LDQASRFIKERVQLKKSAEEITRMVATAPARIKEIEAKLERPSPEEKSVESQASKMEPAKIEQHVRQLESDVAAAGESFTQKVGASIHGQGKLSADLLDEIAFAFFFQSFQLFASIFSFFFHPVFSPGSQ